MKINELPIIRKYQTLKQKRSIISQLNNKIFIEKTINLEDAISHLKELPAFEEYILLHKGSFSGFHAPPYLTKVIAIELSKSKHYIDTSEYLTHLVLERSIPTQIFFKKEKLTEIEIEKLNKYIIDLSKANELMYRSLKNIEAMQKKEKL